MLNPMTDLTPTQKRATKNLQRAKIAIRLKELADYSPMKLLSALTNLCDTLAESGAERQEYLALTTQTKREEQLVRFLEINAESI